MESMDDIVSLNSLSNEERQKFDDSGVTEDETLAAINSLPEKAWKYYRNLRENNIPNNESILMAKFILKDIEDLDSFKQSHPEEFS